MRSTKFKYILPGLMFLFSCKKNLDINTDPNNPSNIEVSKLLPTAEKGLGDALAIGNGSFGGLSEILSVYTHQLTARSEEDKYSATGNNFNLTTSWPTLYQTTLSNIDQVIKLASGNDNTIYTGIAKILKAYTYSQLVDVFGDVPFSEATQLNSGITYPKFDDDAEIYPQLFTLLDEGIADINNTTATNNAVPGSDDVIYGGDVTLWTKAANSIKLKLYTQVRLVQNVTTEVNQLINEGNLISSTDESFLMPYGSNGATDDRNPGFGDYYATQRSHYISPWFYEILKGYNATVNTGIKDPRVPYYFYNQLNKTQPTKDGNPTEYRDSAFVSIYFGSVGPNRDHNQQNSISVLGIYPVGGKYDDGSAINVNSASGTGASPYRFITYADVLYLEAELIHAGIVSGDEKAKLKQAMEESFRQVDYIVSLCKGDQDVPVIAGTNPATNYINSVLSEFDAANTDKKLQVIITEKWISSFGSSVDEYSDYRRTGYPILFDPNNPNMAPNGFVQPPLDGDPVLGAGNQLPVQVQLSKSYPQSLLWYTGELESNPNAPAQKTNAAEYKIFWKP